MTPHTNRHTTHIAPRDPFFDAIRTMVEWEIHPGNTVTFFSEVDLSQVEAIRTASGQDRPSYTAFVIKAVALALRQHPYANRRVCRRIWMPLARPRLQQFDQCDIAVNCERDVPGTATATFADVLRQADTLTLPQITQWLRDLAAADLDNNQQWRAFHNLITRCPLWLSKCLIHLPYMFPSLWTKYRGGAALISSPAKYGVDGVVATWTATLGVSFGLVRERAVVREGHVVARPTFLLTLNFDRRVMAGAQAARYFKHIVDSLEQAQTAMADALPPTARPQGTRHTTNAASSPVTTQTTPARRSHARASANA